MEEKDLDGVMAIEMVSFPTPWPRKLFEEEIGRDFSDALVAVSHYGGFVLGYSICWTIAEESHLLNIAVHPEARELGIGNALLIECMRRGAQAGSKSIYLEVRAGNKPALRMYEKHGFAFQGVRRGYYTDTGEDAIVLSRDLRGEDAR